jgi:AhpD family alkylhydroperoxidase
MAKRDPHQIKKFVQERYGARARERLAGLEATESKPGASASGQSCCAPGKPAEESCCGAAEPPAEERLVRLFYAAEELKDLPEEALSSLGCGNPTAIAGMKDGEHVLDLGSGGGLDCFLAARKVGPSGRVVGLDMTPDMVELARRNAGKVGLSNVEFHQGDIERMPFPDVSFDVIISNCVINLSPDKDAVFRESFRVLRPGGRFRVSDIVWVRAPSEKERSDLESWAGCIAGALMVDEYVGKLSAAGFSDVRARLGDDGGDRGFTSAYVEAERPVAGVPASSESSGAAVGSAATPAVPGTACAEFAGQVSEESGVVGLTVADKELVALGASVGAGCHPCTQYHTQAALKAGLTGEAVQCVIDQAQAVRARGGIAVANVGRRILGVDEQELAAQGPPPCRGSALVWLGAAAGCNSGVLLAEYAAQAAALGLGAVELREAIDVAEMVKSMAGKFLQRDIERALGKDAEPVAGAAPKASCCAPGGTAEVAETVAGAAPGDTGSGCGCGGEGQ